MISKIVAQGKATSKQTFTLKEGFNKIGRRSDSEMKPAIDEVLLQTEDSSIHRHYHCKIQAIINGNTYDYILTPCESATNPTFIGQERHQLHKMDAVYLNENSVFHIGEDTTIVLTK